MPVTYRFGPFVLDTAQRELRANGAVRSLTEKVFGILVLLLEAKGQVVAKNDFFAALWPEEQPSDANLTTHIYTLRQILGELGAGQKVIVTLPGTGYRLATVVESKTGLAMKGSCERCGVALRASDAARICSFECTYCESCAMALLETCPNCKGELAPRPRRESTHGHVS